MPITTYIVDDETAACERLVYLIGHFLNGDLEIVGQSAKPLEALTQIPKLSPELLFLDVEMPGMTSLELAEKLKKTGCRAKVIFVTGFGHYSIKAIRANAFDYLLKPVDVDELKQAVERLKTKVNQLVVKNFGLTVREIELLAFLSNDFSSDEIAKKMF